jgi:hypothetical protein
MDNKIKSEITDIERVLRSEKLSKEQLTALSSFDQFNELEVGCKLSTRSAYLTTLHHLGVSVRKPYEMMSKEDLQNFMVEEGKHHIEGVLSLYKTQLKRFFKFLEWVRVNKEKGDEEKEDIKDVNRHIVFDG